MNHAPGVPRALVTMLAIVLGASSILQQAVAADPPSPYAGEQTRAIKALSPQQVDDLLEGRGMGLAKAAELNGYPGPAHVLELSDALGLNGAQRAATGHLHRTMQARARTVGRALVDAEAALDALFASHRATPAALGAALERIGTLQALLRRVHLEAHLDQARILTPAQIARYSQLRGYHDRPGRQRGSPHRH